MERTASLSKVVEPNASEDKNSRESGINFLHQRCANWSSSRTGLIKLC